MTTQTPTRAEQTPEPAVEVERRVVICGSREWNEPAVIGRLLDALPKQGTVVVSGGARGADRIAAALARRKNIPVEEYPADWDRFGKGAGYRRNEAMLGLDAVTHVFAFRKGQKSPGTDHMVRISRDAGLYVGVVQR